MKLLTAEVLKWIGWRCIRWADKLDGEPVKAGGSD